MKKIFLVLLIFTFVSKAQWVIQTSESGTAHLYDMQFVNQNTGWIVGANNTIVKTTNGGMYWFLQQSDLVYNKGLEGISMIDANTGFISGAYNTIVKTTNGGNNWIVLREAPTGTGNSYHSCSFINAQTGWICGSLGTVLRTTNGGTTWDSLNVENNWLNAILFLNSQTGWTGSLGGLIRKTTDGGNSWSLRLNTPGDSKVNSIYFLNINTGWVGCSSQNAIAFRTTNSGDTWDTLASVFCESIYFINPLTGWCGGSTINGNNEAYIYKSTNSGFNWHRQSLPFTSGFCGSIYALNDSVVCATFGSRIVRTTNGGDPIGIQNITSKMPKQFSLYQNYPNPFNPTTKIRFSLPIPYEGGAWFIQLIIYDLLGRQVENLIPPLQGGQEGLSPGTYEVEWKASNFPSGIYYYKLISGDFTETKKMILVK